MASISRPQGKLPQAFGRYIRPWYRFQHWFVSEDKQDLFYRDEDAAIEEYDQYHRNEAGDNIWYGQRYPRVQTVEGIPLQQTYASLAYVEGTQVVTLHSSCLITGTITSKTRFWEVLRAFENQSMWQHFSCDGDGE